MGLGTAISAFWKALSPDGLRRRTEVLSGEIPQFNRLTFSPTMNKRALLEKYNSWAYKCATLNANAVAETPLRLFTMRTRADRSRKFLFPTKEVDSSTLKDLRRRGSLSRFTIKADTFEEVVEHPFLALWESVNEFHNGFDTTEMLQLHQELAGEAYLFVVRNGMGVPEELWVLRPDLVTPIPDRQKIISHYEFGFGMDRQIIQPEEIIQFKFPNPMNMFRGKGPTEAGIAAITIQEEMHAYEGGVFKNHGQIPMVATHEGELDSRDNQQTFRESFKQRYARGPNQGNVGIMPRGVKLEPLGLPPRDLSFLQGRSWTLKEIAAVYGVPLSKIQPDGTNRATAEVLETQYLRDTVLPRLKRFEQKLNEKLLPMFDERLFVAFDNPIPEDIAARLLERESNLKTGYNSINMEKAIDGEEPVPWGNTPLMPLNIVPLGSAPPEQGSAHEEGGSSHREEDKPKKALVKFETPESAIPLITTVERQRDKIAAILRRTFDRMERDVLTRVKLISSADTAKQYTQTILKSAVEFWLVDKNVWTQEIAEGTEESMKTLIKQGGGEGLVRIGQVATAFDISNPEVLQFVRAFNFKFAESVTKSVNDRLRLQFEQALEAGESIAKIRNRVQDTFESISKHSAERIARTESARAMHAGMEKAWTDSGVVTRKVWLTTSDPCQFCQEMGARFGPGTEGIALGGSFVNQGDVLGGDEDDNKTLSISYGDVSFPPVHPNCLCTIVAVTI